jgi:hypothetical protein
MNFKYVRFQILDMLYIIIFDISGYCGFVGTLTTTSLMGS